jgi:CRISPR/Cas system-associated exonuclease Cas4 (RecB family)
MKVNSLSVSSIASFTHCEHQFYITYILNYKPEPGKAAIFGTIFHKFLELRAKKKDKSIEEILNDYPDSGLLSKDLNDLDKLINKTLLFNNGEFDPRRLEVVDVEKFFEIAVGEVKIRGIIDLITRVDDKTLLAIDWKTGNPDKDFITGKDINEEYLYKSPQIRVYVWSLYKLFPEIDNVIFTMFFAKTGKPYTIIIDKDENWKVEKFLNIKYNKITKVETPSLNKSWKCRFCSHSQKYFGESGQTLCNYFNERNLIDGMEKTIANYTIAKKEHR